MASRLSCLVAVLAAVLTQGSWGGSLEAVEPPQRRPVSLISSRLLMLQGRPAVPVADLAQALGGAARFNEASSAYSIQPGPGSLLRFDASGRGALQRPHRVVAEGEASRPGGEELPSPPSLYIGTALASEKLVLQGREPYLLLEELAELFGGGASFDASLGQWFIVGSQPGRLLAFR